MNKYSVMVKIIDGDIEPEDSDKDDDGTLILTQIKNKNPDNTCFALKLGNHEISRIRVNQLSEDPRIREFLNTRNAAERMAKFIEEHGIMRGLQKGVANVQHQ